MRHVRRCGRWSPRVGSGRAWKASRSVHTAAGLPGMTCHRSSLLLLDEHSLLLDQQSLVVITVVHIHRAYIRSSSASDGRRCSVVAAEKKKQEKKNRSPNSCCQLDPWTRPRRRSRLTVLPAAPPPSHSRQVPFSHVPAATAPDPQSIERSPGPAARSVPAATVPTDVRPWGVTPPPPVRRWPRSSSKDPGECP